MTSQSPRIYLYKITFEEVPYYYYGIHKEKNFNEYYMGSPKTHEWYWDFYTPKKQILQLFDFTDEGWLEAQEVEKRLIKPVFNTDKWCLNESCGGLISLNILSNAGKKGGNSNKNNKTGFCGRSPEKMSKDGKKVKELGVGVFAMSSEERSSVSHRAGTKCKENGNGIFGLTPEQWSENSKKGASQRWMCLETGHITNAGALALYQKHRGIDTSKRVRIS